MGMRIDSQSPPHRRRLKGPYPNGPPLPPRASRASGFGVSVQDS
jgi:hypothetical protein